MEPQINQMRENMEKAITHFSNELKKIRTGRANPQMLENVKVEVYGQSMPLPHISNINAVDSNMLMVTPFDPNNLEAISAAIREDKSLGLNPADDGKVIRLPIPPLTTERREEIVKQVHARAEETKISLRNVRHELINEAKKLHKNNDITDDDYHSTEKQANEIIDEFQKKIDSIASAKEKEVMTV